MAIRPVAPHPETPQPDEHKDSPAAPKAQRGQRSNRSAQRPAAKMGQHEEEHDIHHDAQMQRAREAEAAQVKQAELKAKAAPAEALKKQLNEQRERQNRNMGGGSAGGGSSGGQADQARNKGFQITPGVGDFVKGQSEPKTGSSFAELLPISRTRASSLPEPEMRPPIFLSQFEGMKDIYLRVKGRASPKTRELLEGPGLEDLVKVMIALNDDETKSKAPDARVFGPLYTKIKAEPGPLLTGLNDPRLSEPWRLFLEGWEIWLPDKAHDKNQTGVELFIEGEGEDDEGEPMEILQMLRIVGSEVTLETKIGALKDRVAYDGERFFRLKSDATA